MRKINLFIPIFLLILMSLIVGYLLLTAQQRISTSPKATAIPSLTQNTFTPFDSQLNPPKNTPIPTITPTTASDPILVGAGDIARCNNNGDEKTAELIEQIPGTVFTAGDNVYDYGTPQEFSECYGPSWGRFKNRTRPAAGNHEYGTVDAQGYFDYFGNAAGEPGKGYYSYDLGNWHIIVLNSSIDVTSDSTQELWLRADLEANPTLCTLAYWHDPLFSSGSVHGGSGHVRPLWQALYDYHAEVVINGHEHNYERFALQSPQGEADSTGIREFVVGTGGGHLYDFGYFAENSEARYNASYGVLKLTLHADSYDWEFIPEPGVNYTDSGIGQCIE